jgi:plasmid stability protein
MTSITISNIDDEVARRLQLKAAGHGRSVEEEARNILISALSMKQDEETYGLGTAIHALFEPLGGVEVPEVKREPMRTPPEFDRDDDE